MLEYTAIQREPVLNIMPMRSLPCSRSATTSSVHISIATHSPSSRTVSKSKYCVHAGEREVGQAPLVLRQHQQARDGTSNSGMRMMASCTTGLEAT